MGKLLLFTVILMTANLTASAQTSADDYRIYDSQGDNATFNQMIAAAAKSDVVFLGENHDDAAAHYLQSEVFKKIFERYGKSREIVLSMEMFERDTQIILNEYLEDLITEKKFLDDSRPWNNYKTDYRPLIEFAKQNKLNVIAANAPRRYVNMVSRSGRAALDQLSPEAKKWLAPLPYAPASEDYSKKFINLMGGMSGDNHGLTKILDSQTLWDATMAFSIAEYLRNNKNPLIVHLNGSFHTENRLGTVEHLLKYQPKTKILVVTMKSIDNYTKFDKTEFKNAGDFIVLTDSKLPRSFKSGN